MSGIAGMVLTLGMAVDANVLIYERTKEEMRSGKNISAAVSAGYSNAFSAIFDSNVTTILTGIILYNFGTGPIKGFATTLIIGIVCSFFTAVWLTRIAYEHFLNRGKWQDLTFTTKFSQNMMKDTKYNFMGNYKKSFIAFGIFLVIVLVSFGLRGLSQSIDFTGGRNYKVEFVKQVEPEAVKAAIVKQFEANNPDGEAINVTVIAIGTEGNNVRVSTNFNIEDNSSAADAQIESLLYQAFVDGGMVDKSVSEEAFLDRDNRAGGSIISSQKVGPAIASDILRGAVLSVLFAIVVIFLYILIRFRNVAYSVGSIVALTLDTVLVIGMFSLCYGWIGFSLEVDQTFIGAILTVIGYSINDKVVIFDRIREVFKNYPKRDRQRIFNDALNSTLARTINTSVSTFIVLLVIFVLGGDSIRAFAFAMMLGVIIGTSSSLFIAAPTAYLVMGARIKEAEEETESAQ
jgi:SecD/SecF fusion protein